MSNTAVVTAPVTSKVHKPDFGNGRYSPLKEEVWHDSQVVFNISSEAAEKLANQIASDLGAVMANSPVKVKLGKINDDGKMTISEACKVKGITMTNPLTALKALHFAGEAGKNGFSFGNTKWAPMQGLQTYLLSL